MKISAFRSDASVMPVSAVHYLKGGRPVSAKVMIPSALGRRWREIKEHNCMLTAEVLTTGEVSLTIAHPAGGDFIVEIAQIGPDIRKAVVRLIERWDATQFRVWLAKALRDYAGV